MTTLIQIKKIDEYIKQYQIIIAYKLADNSVIISVFSKKTAVDALELLNERIEDHLKTQKELMTTFCYQIRNICFFGNSVDVGNYEMKLSELQANAEAETK